MANPRMQQFLYSLNHMLTYIEGSVAIGASGSVSSIKGSGVASVAHLATGVYQVSLGNCYNRLLSIDITMDSPSVGSVSSVSAITPGTLYTINTVGTTTAAQWQTAGLDARLTPTVGQSFVAAATSAGTGTAKPITNSGIMSTEVAGDPQLTINNGLVGSALGGFITLQTLNTSGVATNPTSGSKIRFGMMLRNSSVKGAGE